MADNEVTVESVELALLSGIRMSSAIMMKHAYLPDSVETMDEERDVPCSRPEDSCEEDGLTGPNAVAYITKLSNRTPDEEIERILVHDPERTTNTGTHDFYTLVFTIRMWLGDPSTTRFINGTIELAFPPGIKILTYSPKEKGTITGIIENGGDTISLTPGLDFLASAAQSTTLQPDPEEHRFGIMVGPEEKISATYSQKSGYSLALPACFLLEYQGMLKNEHEMFWEIYPPMPHEDREITGKEMHAVFSLIVQVPKNSPLTLNAHIEGRVKGNLWGVISIKGTVVL